MIFFDYENLLLGKRLINTETECWEWQGTINCSNKYGVVKISRQMEYVHRLSALLWIKNFNSALCVLHRCDNRKCFNPEHLFQGTKAENVYDMDNKDRRIPAHVPKILNKELVHKIRNDYDTGKQQFIIAKELNLSRQIINDVIKRKTWKHI